MNSSWVFQSCRAEREHGEGGEPMLAGIVATGHLRQRRGDQLFRAFLPSQAGKAPCTRQAQAVEMTLLGVGVILHPRQLGERAEALWRKTLYPALKLARLHHLHHEQRLDEARRKKIVQRRLEGERRGAIALVPPARRLADLELERCILRRASIVDRKEAGECGVAVAAGADRIRRFANELHHPRGKLGCERRERA